jgi:Leucine-rich repeat (LRR) protein
VKQENVVKPTNPLTAKAQTVISVYAKHHGFPDGDADKVRYFDNERTIRMDTEHRVPRITSNDLPVLVRDDTAREVLLNAFITGNRVVTGDPNVDVFSRSISCNSVFGNLSSDVLKLFPDWSGDCNSDGHQICSFDKSKRTFDGSYDSSIKMIPSCIKQFVKLENLYLNRTGVSKIEGLENNINLEWLVLGGTGVSKIEGLENNVKLRWLYLNKTNVSKIEGLENNVKLKWLDLTRTMIKKIEGLENNVNLNRLDLGGTGVSKSDCDEFKEARPGVSLSC